MRSVRVYTISSFLHKVFTWSALQVQCFLEVMSDPEDFSGVEHSKSSVTKNSLTFLLEGIDPRDLAADGLSIISYADSEWSTGGVRDEPTCQELAIEGGMFDQAG